MHVKKSLVSRGKERVVYRRCRIYSYKISTPISNSDTYGSVRVPVATYVDNPNPHAKGNVTQPLFSNAISTMKSAADPCEFFRWKSACGRLVVRTKWVKGVRHVILSDDDDDDGGGGGGKEKRQRLQRPGTNKTAANRPASGAHDAKENRVQTTATAACNDNDGDDNYVERVLQWLQKPSGMLETCRKPMSAPENCMTSVYRRPALVKTCSIPEHKYVDGRTQVEIVKRPTKSTCNPMKNHQKTELHVHMPSMCLTGGKIIKDDDYS